MYGLILQLFAYILMSSGQAIRFEIQTRRSCPEGFSCETIKVCPVIWSLYRKGKNLEICGWSNDMPFVCCPSNTVLEDPSSGARPDNLTPNFDNIPPCVNEELPDIGEISGDEAPHIDEETPFRIEEPLTVSESPVEEVEEAEDEAHPDDKRPNQDGEPLTVGLNPFEKVEHPVEEMPNRQEPPTVGLNPVEEAEHPDEEMPNRHEEPLTVGFNPVEEAEHPDEEMPNRQDEPLTVGLNPVEEAEHPDEEIPNRNEQTDVTRNPIEKAPPGEVVPDIEDVKFILHEDKKQPATERLPVKLSYAGPGRCGIKMSDSSSNIPRYALRTVTTDPSSEDTFRISVVGGSMANEKWSWMVAIYKRRGQRPFCGGTLIDDRHIITAAHCFDHKIVNASLYVVKIGEIDLRAGYITRDLDEIKIHENYKPTYYYDDIAIIRLAKRIEGDVIPACLPEEDSLIDGDKLTVLGYGDLSFGGRSSNTLQEAHGLPVIEKDKCNDKFAELPGNNFPIGITSNMICAGLEEGGVDACQGDSGGPLLHEFDENKWILVGVVSFGFRCAEPGYPGVYTRISSYFSWIRQYIDVDKLKYAPRPIYKILTSRPLYPTFS